MKDKYLMSKKQNCLSLVDLIILDKGMSEANPHGPINFMLCLL